MKRDGRKVAFDPERIMKAIDKAILATKGRDFLEQKSGRNLRDLVFEGVLGKLSQRYGLEGTPHVEEIQNAVEQSLMESNLYDVAKAYVLYRKERERIREEKKRLLGRDYVDEVDKEFSPNAIRLLASRYLLRDEKGKIIEGPKQMFQRVAALVVISDILHDPKVFDKEAGQHISQSSKRPDFGSLVGLIGLGRHQGGGFEIEWNYYHFERMHELFSELANQDAVKVSWDELLDMLKRGEFEGYLRSYHDYYNLMVKKKFLPNSPTLFNAGARLGQLSACFVVPIEDSIESIMKAASDCALIFKSGGGVGINYSALRPQGDIVASTGGVASGPVTFMRIIDTVTEVVKQGGKRRGANMGILEISHPDIETFIRSKDNTGQFENFNISVLISPEFWSSYESGRPWPLKNPRDGSIWRTANPKELFNEIATMAWNDADPGIVFLDIINKHNPMRKHWGDIRCVNPCGEQPLYPHESCNLGSINIYAFVNRDARGHGISIDWEELSKSIEVSVRFLDNVIDLNRFPIREISKISKETRRIGLGLMGLADALYALELPYDSEEAFELMSKIAEFFAYHSTRASTELSRERGPFPFFDRSDYKSGNLAFDAFYERKLWTMDWDSVSREVASDGIRNSHTLTIAPTGSISMIADVSSGLEPQFALVFEKHVTVGDFYYTDQELERRLAEGERSLDDSILREISDNGGSLQGLENFKGSKDSRVFLVSYDIPWWDHIRAQHEMQKWISTSVSKTINMPSWTTAEDVEKAYLFAYRLGLKGLTIYRDGSKDEQVLRTPSQKRNKYAIPKGGESSSTIRMMRELGIAPPLEEVLDGDETEPGTRKAPPLARDLSSSSTENLEVLQAGRPIAKCPNCGGVNIVSQEGCRKCLDCGWSTCTIA